MIVSLKHFLFTSLPYSLCHLSLCLILSFSLSLSLSLSLTHKPTHTHTHPNKHTHTHKHSLTLSLPSSACVLQLSSQVSLLASLEAALQDEKSWNVVLKRQKKVLEDSHSRITDHYNELLAELELAESKIHVSQYR